MGALALAVLMLLTACATGAPREGSRYRYYSPTPQEFSEESGQDAEIEDEEAGEGEAVFALLPTDFRPVQVGDSEFAAALAGLMLDIPLRVATTELREVGERFGRVIGPNSVRILVLVGTAAIGETAALVSKAPKLPGFGQASRTVELNTGWNLMEAAVEAERVIVSVPEGTLRAVLPMTAVAMTARSGDGKSSGGGSGTPKEGRVLPSGHRAFKSFGNFKDFMGPAGEGKQWHHIIEKREANLKRFGAEALHNTENIISLDKDLHTRVSAFYSSIQKELTGSRKLTVRMWLGTQSYEAQRQFGLIAIENIRRGLWK